MGYISEIVEIPATNNSVSEQDMYFINWTDHDTEIDTHGYDAYILSDNKWEGNT